MGAVPWWRHKAKPGSIRPVEFLDFKDDSVQMDLHNEGATNPNAIVGRGGDGRDVQRKRRAGEEWASDQDLAMV